MCHIGVAKLHSAAASERDHLDMLPEAVDLVERKQGRVAAVVWTKGGDGLLISGAELLDLGATVCTEGGERLGYREIYLIGRCSVPFSKPARQVVQT